MATPLRNRPLDRRTFLRGAGATLALPWLEAMAPLRSPVGEPTCWVFLFAPNGKKMDDWTPAKAGGLLDLPYLLEPLRPHRRRLLVLSGLTLDGGRAHGDGPGDHARAAASFLTAAHPRKTGGVDIHNGVSVDQRLAAAIGAATRFGSLELGMETGKAAGACDSGYSCAYSNNIAWRSPTQPVAKETDPRQVFARLFGDPTAVLDAAARARAGQRQRSVLDLVRSDADRLRRKVGAADRAKLEEYLTAVREIEARLQQPAHDAAAVPVPDGLGGRLDYRSRLRLMYDLIVLGLRTDSTRIVTFMLGNAGSNRSYPFLDVHDGHHSLSHHGGQKDKLEGIRRINRFHVEELARFVSSMAEVDGGALLERTALVYGSGIGDGNRHNHHDLPILLLGDVGARGGRHLRYPKNTPLANLYLSLLHRAGVEDASFGDSAGPLRLA